MFLEQLKNKKLMQKHMDLRGCIRNVMVSKNIVVVLFFNIKIKLKHTSHTISTRQWNGTSVLSEGNVLKTKHLDRYSEDQQNNAIFSKTPNYAALLNRP